LDTVKCNLEGLAHFKLSMFIPMAALIGFVKKESLWMADQVTPSKDIATGSYAALSKVWGPDHDPFSQFSFLENLSEMMGEERLNDGTKVNHFGRRLSIPESCCCETNREKRAWDSFLLGQHIFHLFLEKQRTNSKQAQFVAKVKKSESELWEELKYSFWWEFTKLFEEENSMANDKRFFPDP